MSDGQGASSQTATRGGTPRRQNTKVSGSSKRGDTKSVRVQLHLPDEVVKRLGVHCSLVGRNQSREAGRILLSFLAHRGQGRELFKDSPDLDLDGPEDLSD